MRAALLGLVALVLAGCSSSGAAKTDAANPLSILHKLPGCIIAPGITIGTDDGFGGHYAACLQPGHPGVTYTDEATVYTVDSAAHRTAQLRALQAQHLPMTRFILGPGFVLTNTGHLVGGRTEYTPSLTQIANESGGRLLPAS